MLNEQALNSFVQVNVMWASSLFISTSNFYMTKHHLYQLALESIVVDIVIRMS